MDGRNMNPPVEVGEELDVKIEAVGEKGDGIAKKDGFVLFIPGVNEGDEVRVRITKVLRKVGFAEVVGEGSSAAEESDSEEPEAEAPEEEPVEEPTSEDSEDFGEGEAEEEPEAEMPDVPSEEPEAEAPAEEEPAEEDSEEKKEE